MFICVFVFISPANLAGIRKFQPHISSRGLHDGGSKRCRRNSTDRTNLFFLHQMLHVLTLYPKNGCSLCSARMVILASAPQTMNIVIMNK